MQVCENEAREKHTKKPTVICSPYISDVCKITIEDQSSVLGLAITHLKEKKKNTNNRLGPINPFMKIQTVINH